MASRQLTVLALALLLGCQGVLYLVQPPDPLPPGVGEDCTTPADDDNDGAPNCADDECWNHPICLGNLEVCGDSLDNDGDGDADCMDCDCLASCPEICGNSLNDNCDALTDCEDPNCRAVDPACGGELCTDGNDNDGDTLIDCADPDCAALPACVSYVNLCPVNSPSRPCQCEDGIDNDNDGLTDAEDPQCFGPQDDLEDSYATGIPGDNNGQNAPTECPFDGNSGIGNDAACCGLLPNGCDKVACCEWDVNGNGTGEHVGQYGDCGPAPQCGDDASYPEHGCACSGDGDCGSYFCVRDNDTGAGFCSTCVPCAPDPACYNPCTCGETCFAGFSQPASECTSGGGCPAGVTQCTDDTQCDTTNNERCSSGCCYQVCDIGVQPCQFTSECPSGHFCITGCCTPEG
ncbi:MAG: hypothetical protein HYZ27_00345 [Deltaproteobacteria bacterium]|nr:hypothetical protein [Deltaproteobacteria bacterium]